MLVIDFENNKEYTLDSLPKDSKDSFLMLVSCNHEEMIKMRDELMIDHGTVLDEVNIDESVRFTAFEGYEFVSLLHMELENDKIIQTEINLYISKQYIILVMPEDAGPMLRRLEEKLVAFTRHFLQNNDIKKEKTTLLSQSFFLFFDTLISDFFITLEKLEDRMQELSKEISVNVTPEQFDQIQNLREIAYVIRKVLRAFSYIGFQILCNENDILGESNMYLFRNLETRFRKLYDFASSIYDLSAELVRTYDSKTSQGTNDIVNRLTFVTIIFAPLTLITGIYGMNFLFMPELKMPWAYPVALIVMALIGIGLYIFMKKKKWL